MKMKLLHITFLAIGIALFTACHEEMCQKEYEDKVRVQFTLPGKYVIPASQYKDSKHTLAEWNTELTDDMLQYLDDGSTLWLAVYEKESGGTEYDTKPTELKSYVVRNVGGEYHTLYTCKVDDEGNVIEEGDTPLFLHVGKSYKFRVISPARKLIDKEKLHVRNGDYLLATDDRYEQTMSKEITITENTPGVTYVKLNPLLQQTAQIRFSVEAGENVHRFDVLPAGIEVSGIQDDVLHENLYNWTTSQPLHMYLGSKHSKITIKEFTKDDHGCITGETALLPTDAVSSSIVVLINLGVNSINSQYTLMLNNMKIEAAHSYNFKIKVMVKDNITVAVWQNQSWETDMELKETK